MIISQTGKQITVFDWFIHKSSGACGHIIKGVIICHKWVFQCKYFTIRECVVVLVSMNDNNLSSQVRWIVVI